MQRHIQHKYTSETEVDLKWVVIITIIITNDEMIPFDQMIDGYLKGHESGDVINGIHLIECKMKVIYLLY